MIIKQKFLTLVARIREVEHRQSQKRIKKYNNNLGKKVFGKIKLNLRISYINNNKIMILDTFSRNEEGKIQTIAEKIKEYVEKKN